ncbi:MAG: hypothetical protein HY826_11905 [Actinobacteria bacterium]|nr:hypothetical protein [Actinomycetota bacterium]
MTFTEMEMVMEPVAQLAAPSRKHRWWSIPLATLGTAAVLAPLVATLVPSTVFIDKSRCTEFDTAAEPTPRCVNEVDEAVEFALVPADAEPVLPRLEIEGVTTYDGDGDVYFVTIRQPPITMLDWFVTRDNKASRFFSHRDKYGDQTEDQLVQSGQRQMRSAKDNAMYVALKAAGYDVTIREGDVIIDFLLCLVANEAGTECVTFSPADELLDPGDVLKEVAGTKIDIIDDLSQVLDGIDAGEMIEVSFERDGVAMSGQIETILAPGEDPPRTIIGFRPIDTTTVALPEGLTVEVNTESIGGPSAGLAFTLALIDALTEGDLMGGLDIAVTGTIDIEGNVGAIGGLNSKASAVQQVGVRYFLVPFNQGEGDDADGLPRARAVVGDDVEIIPVKTLQEALDALVRLGGDPVKLSGA